MRPRVNEVTWDFYYYNSTPEFSYRVETSREDRLNYFKLRYILPGSKDKTRYFYGETAWMNITRFIRDYVGDWTFNIDRIEDDLLDSYLNTLVDLKGSC